MNLYIETQTNFILYRRRIDVEQIYIVLRTVGCSEFIKTIYSDLLDVNGISKLLIRTFYEQFCINEGHQICN